MPSSQKTTKNTAGGPARRTKFKQKLNQPQVEKPAPSSEAETEEAIAETETVEVSKRKSGAPATPARERKSGALTTSERESKLSPTLAAPRERKLTPQQQMHVDRARRRRLNERLGIGLVALVIIVIVVVVAWQAIAKNALNAQIATLHAAETATVSARATATENAVAPATPPNVTGTPVTTADGLQYIDITTGSGPAAKSGDMLAVQYTGWVQASDVKFDSSYDSNAGKPFTFTLGQMQVIAGWDEGLVGMKVGGKRRLIIPPSLGYKDQANGSIPANSTLIFDVQLVSVNGQTK